MFILIPLLLIKFPPEIFSDLFIPHDADLIMRQIFNMVWLNAFDMASSADVHCMPFYSDYRKQESGLSFSSKCTGISVLFLKLLKFYTTTRFRNKQDVWLLQTDHVTAFVSR